MSADARRWTEEQREAIEARDKEILVSAGAGSGKTSVLVERIVRRVLDDTHPVDLDRMLVVTFTEAAAGEMKERIRRSLQEVAEAGGPAAARAGRQLRLMGKASISTLHAFCLNVLRRYFFLIDLDPRFRVMGEEETALLKLDVLDEVLEEVRDGEDNGDEEDMRRLFDDYGGRLDDSALREIILALNDYLRSIPDAEQWLAAAEEAYEQDSEARRTYWQRWQQSIFARAEGVIEDALESLEQAAVIARLPHGPHTYEASFSVARETLQRVEEAIRIRDFDGTKRALQAVEWPRLNAPPESYEALRDEAQQYWNAAKAVVKDIMDKDFSRSLETFEAEVRRLSPTVRQIGRLARRFDERLAAAKARQGAVDFSDLEQFALTVLEQPDSPALRAYRDRYDEVLVDEYQDINPVQDRLIRQVSRPAPAGNRFMVGDVKQSIYRFRLADPGIFLRRQRQFARSEAAGQQRVDLNANFRSHPRLLSFVNFVFRQIMFEAVGELDYDERALLRPGLSSTDIETSHPVVQLHVIDTDAVASSDQGGDEPRADRPPMPLSGEELEALKAGQLIQELRAEGYRYKDIVILMRSPKNRAGPLIEVLEHMGIPAYSHTGTGFFKAVEVELVLSLLRLCDNPRDDLPLAAVLRSPIGGFDETDLAQVRAYAPEGPYHHALMQYVADNDDALAHHLQSFLRQIDAWRTMARRLPLSRLIRQLYKETGYVDFVAALPGGARREANLKALYESARSFDRDRPHGLERFIRFVDKLDEARREVAPPAVLGEGEDVVQVMSVHKSKGLEFPVVILLNLDRQWSRMDTRGNVIFHRDMGLAAAVVDRTQRIRYPSLPYLAAVHQMNRDSLAEEMRLLYVAFTRARERLFMIAAARNVSGRAAEWSGAGGQRGWPLSLGRAGRARSWLDWIGSAVARHRDGKPLRAVGAGDLGVQFYPLQDEEVAREDMAVGVHIHPADEVAAASPDYGPTASPAPERPPQKSVADADQEELFVFLTELHAWSYPHGDATRMPAKVSVTEASRRLDIVEEAEPLLVQDEQGQPIQRSEASAVGADSAVLQDLDAAVDARLAGIITHTFLAHIDLTGPMDISFLRAEAARLTEMGYFHPGESSALDVSGIARFFASELGEQLRRAASLARTEQKDGATSARVWRELPFMLRPDPVEGESIIQGTIDCLLRVGDRYTLIDYKTDRVDPGREIQRASGAYTRQMGYYAQFVRRIAQDASLQCYIVFLRTGEAVPIKVPPAGEVL